MSFFLGCFLVLTKVGQISPACCWIGGWITTLKVEQAWSSHGLNMVLTCCRMAFQRMLLPVLAGWWPWLRPWSSKRWPEASEETVVQPVQWPATRFDASIWPSFVTGHEICIACLLDADMHIFSIVSLLKSIFRWMMCLIRFLGGFSESLYNM